MALADSVPGVSGGTVAFLLGFYDKFINSLNAIISGDKNEKKTALAFLIKLGIGWIIGFTAAVNALAKVFDEHIYQISSLFLGFIILAIPIVLKEEKKFVVFNWQTIISGIIGILLVVLITLFNPVSSSEAAMNLTELNIGTALYVAIAGMFAISAMILPGISGSTILLIFGLYIPLISAVNGILHLKWEYLPVICIFIIGIIFGLATVVRFVHMSLQKHRHVMLFFIIGMMIGSFYAIVMGPTTLSEPKNMLTLDSFSILWFLIGGVILYILQFLKQMLEKFENKRNNN